MTNSYVVYTSGRNDSSQNGCGPHIHADTANKQRKHSRSCGGRTKSCTTHPVKYKKASKMGCKGPFDARFEAIETSRRALSDYAIQNAQKRNFSKMACSIFLPQNIGKNVQKNKKNINRDKENKKTNRRINKNKSDLRRMKSSNNI